MNERNLTKIFVGACRGVLPTQNGWIRDKSLPNSDVDIHTCQCGPTTQHDSCWDRSSVLVFSSTQKARMTSPPHQRTFLVRHAHGKHGASYTYTYMSCYRALDLWREIVPVVLEAETGLQIEYGVRQKVVLDLSYGEPKNRRIRKPLTLQNLFC
jgi:hypothetical protein